MRQLIMIQLIALINSRVRTFLQQIDTYHKKSRDIFFQNHPIL